MEQKKTIVLDMVFAGEYLNEGSNIGHEIINFFKDDCGDNYIYVTPNGKIDVAYSDNIKALLLVRRYNWKVAEILYKAEGLVKIPKDSSLQNSVKYGGVALKDIFAENTDNDYPIKMTFKAEKVCKINKPVYITTEKSYANEEDADCPYYYLEDMENFCGHGESLKRYISESDKPRTSYYKPKSYKKLLNLINNDELWAENNQTIADIKQTKVKTEVSNLKINNIIKILGKQYDEISYSNFLSYIFVSNKKGFCKFAQEILKIYNLSENYTVEREKDHIDLLIEDVGNVVIIENKIKSGINGVKVAKGQHGCTEISSQLKEYLKKGKERANSGVVKRKLNCFVFVPNYNRINLEKYVAGNEYTVITYKEIYDFFSNNTDMYDGIPYFNEFLYALSLHVKAIDSNKDEVMYERFVATIERAKSRTCMNEEIIS